MFIECVSNNNIPYLRIVEGYSYTENGVRKNRRRIVKNIGPLSRYDDGKPNYLERLRESFSIGEPIIPWLAEHCENKKGIARKITIEFDPTNDQYAFASPRNIGYFLFDGLFDALGIYDVLNLHKSRKGIGYDLIGIARLLVIGRALFPKSKIGTYQEKDKYLFPVTKCENHREVYSALDILNEKAETIQKRMNLKIRQSIGRNTEVCFYDVTNYYFEIDENDLDKPKEDGNGVKPGLRKKGVSKENRLSPIVQMGLFIDDNGIPISYQLFPGNCTDQTTLRPAMRRTIDTMEFGKVIIVADGGLNSGPNIAHIRNHGNGYIVSKSTKKCDKKVKAWILDDAGYRWNDTKTFKVKSQIRTRKIKAEDGSVQEIDEKLICYFSKRHYERERHENGKFIEYLESVIAFPDKLKDKPRKIEKFLKKEEIDKATGEIIQTATTLSLDMKKIQEYLDLMGYYTIMTSEIDRSDEEIISKYHGLSRIEDSFRVVKSDLEARPVFVRTPEHIGAHFLTCFVALVMIRMIQHQILTYQGKPTRNTEHWESGLSAERIQTALSNWQADPLPGGYYRLSKPTDDLTLILSAFGISGDLRFPIEPHIRKLKHAVDDAIMCLR